MRPVPVVSGISPNQGVPGTKVKIRGENLGSSPEDLIGLVIISCDRFLTAEWKSSKLILATSGLALGEGDVIVRTKSGGEGFSTVKFNGLAPGPIGILTPCSVWVDEEEEEEEPHPIHLNPYPSKLQDIDIEDAKFLMRLQEISSRYLLLKEDCNTLENLKNKLADLHENTNFLNEEKLVSLRENIDDIWLQYRTILAVKEAFTFHESARILLNLKKTLKESGRKSRSLIEDLSRANKEHKTAKDTLNVLVRYKFLFCLPNRIEKNIEAQKFEEITGDFQRLNAMKSKPNGGIFDSLLKEIEVKFNLAKEVIEENLLVFPQKIEDQQFLLECLFKFRAREDPALKLLEMYKNFIISLLKPFWSAAEEGEDNTLQVVLLREISNMAQLIRPYLKEELDKNVASLRKSKFEAAIATILKEYCKGVKNLMKFYKIRQHQLKKLHLVVLSLSKFEEISDELLEDCYVSMGEIGGVLVQNLTKESAEKIKQLADEERREDYNGLSTSFEDLMEGLLANLKVIAGLQRYLKKSLIADANLKEIEQLFFTFVGVLRGLALEGKEEYLLVVLSNCQYSKLHMLNRLKEVFSKNGFPTCMVGNFQKELLKLEKETFRIFIKGKRDTIRSVLQNSSPNFYQSAEPIEISCFAKEVIFEVVKTKAQLFHCSLDSNRDVIFKMVEELALDLNRTTLTHMKHGDAVIQQLVLDVYFLQKVCDCYSSSFAKDYFCDILRRLHLNELCFAQDVFKKILVPMRLQIFALSQIETQ